MVDCAAAGRGGRGIGHLTAYNVAIARDGVARVGEDDVAPGAAADCVVIAAHDVDAVVATAARDDVRVEVAEQLVIARAAGDAVRSAVAADAVGTVVAEDPIVSRAAGDRVLPGASVELVGAPLAVDVVRAA